VRWVINGEAFDPLRVDVTPRLGDVEVWRFVNRGFVGQTMLHPVHTHLAPFQIRRRNGGAPLRQEAGWKDTVAIEDGEEVDAIMRWSGYRGRYVLQCHNLEHEDHGMMARIDVIWIGGEEHVPQRLRASIIVAYLWIMMILLGGIIMETFLFFWPRNTIMFVEGPAVHAADVLR
jgi:Multicopper oxidase